MLRFWLPVLGLGLATGATPSVGLAQQETAPEAFARLDAAMARLEALESRAPASLLARGSLGALEQELCALYRTLTPSLVEIRSSIVGAAGEREIATAGVVLTADGLVVAPLFAAVVEGAPFAVQVRRVDGARFAGVVLERNDDYGLALIRVEGLRGMQPRLFPGEWLPEGSPVIALGNAFGLEGSMSLGLVNGRSRFAGSARRLLQITNPVNPGDGGGLLASSRGEVVGILLSALPELAEAGIPVGVERAAAESSPAAPDATSNRALRAEGIGFAVPIEIVASLFPEQLGELMRRRRALGVEVSSRLLVAESSGGPERRWAVEVKRVLEGSAAAAAGVQTDDVLLELDQVPLATLEDLGFAMFHAPAQTRLKVLRGGSLLLLELDFGAWSTPLPEFGLPPPLPPLPPGEDRDGG